MKELLTSRADARGPRPAARDRLGARDLERAMTFRQWNERSCRLANALLGLGLSKGDRVAVLAYNCVEWAEIYAATAKAGLVAVPINFRLVGPEVRFIVEDAGASALIVAGRAGGRRRGDPRGPAVPAANLIHFGERPCPAGLPRLRGPGRGGERRRARRAGRARRPVDDDVHLGHDRQPEGRAAEPQGLRPDVPRHRDRARRPPRATAPCS